MQLPPSCIEFIRRSAIPSLHSASAANGPRDVSPSLPARENSRPPIPNLRKYIIRVLMCSLVLTGLLTLTTLRTDASNNSPTHRVASGRTDVGGPTDPPDFPTRDQYRTGQSVSGGGEAFVTKSPIIWVRISGRVTSDGTTGISGVRVRLIGLHSRSTFTDMFGNYSFINLPSGDNYKVSPYMHGRTFAPLDQSFTNLQADQTDVNFTIEPVSFSGKVTIDTATGAGLAGVTMTLTSTVGFTPRTVLTASDGTYSFSNLPTRRTYQLRPSKTNYIFRPGGRVFYIATLNQTNKNFIATLKSYTISGMVKLGAARLSGVTVELTSPAPAGFTTRTTTTSSTGAYSFTKVPSGRDYTVTPQKSGYQFTPANKMLTNLSGNHIGVNFLVKVYSITGRITRTGTTTGISAVTVTITSPTPAGFPPRTVQTYASGNYWFYNLPAGRDYTIKPMKTGLTFSPPTRNITNLSSDIPAGASTNFTDNGNLTPPQISISPANGATINTTTPMIEITYGDDFSGVDRATLTVTIDGLNYTNLFTVTDTKASYLASFGGGQHTIEASIKDMEGNLGQATSRFTVSAFRALPEATPNSGVVPLTVTFITKAEYTDGAIIRYRWDFQGDGIFDTNDPGARNYTRTFTQKGTFNAVLEVTNDRNQVTTATVPIDVTGNPPVATASLSPSNGAIPLLVNFSGAGIDSDGTIVKFEWDFDGDGTFDFTSATTGNTTHTYDTAGTYNAVFRVTDNDDLTDTARVTTTAVRAGPPGSPTATITSPANPLTVTAPNTVNFNGTGSDSDGTIASYEWDFDGNGVYDYSSLTSAATSFRYESPGTFTAALRVTDDSGLTGIDTIDITVNLPITLTLSTDTCRPLQGGTISVNTTQAGATPITIFIRNRAGQTIKTLVHNVPRAAGSYSDTWDCKDTNGSIVPEGAYYAILQYLANGQVKTLDLTNTTGGQFYNPGWTMSMTGGPVCFNCPFRPLENNFLKVDFTLSKASEVSVSIRLFNRVDEVVSLFDRKLFGRGSYTAFWDGTDITGVIVAPPPGEQFLWGMTAFTLPNNAIFVEDAPQLTNVSANPNYFDPSTGDFISPQNPTTKITYTLTKQANVSLQVFRSGTNTLRRTIVQPNVAAGTGAIEWDGRDSNGIFVDKGDYRLAVKATDATGNQSIVRYVLVRVFY
jgi:PKD repeat protein